MDHLEQKFNKLQKHVVEQDAEMFRMSKQIDKMDKRLKQLEGRLKEAGLESPVDTAIDPVDEKPPHY